MHLIIIKNKGGANTLIRTISCVQPVKVTKE
jgi:hypothetical protein